MSRDLAHYMELSYPFEMTLYDDVFEAEFRDLHGCVSHGSTPSEAYENLLEAKRAWIEKSLELGMEIPEPSPEIEQYSGRILLRCPKVLHMQLIEMSKHQNTSLNQLISCALSAYVARGGRYAAEIEWGLAYEKSLLGELFSSRFREGVTREVKHGVPAVTWISPKAELVKVV